MSADLKQPPFASVASGRRPDAHDALPTGTRFGEFEIIRVIGAGGFSIVYLAHDHSLERRVALKEYLPAMLAKRGEGGRALVLRGSGHSVVEQSVAGHSIAAHSVAETYAIGLRSFMNEARLLARFDHPSLVKVYRFWEENATAYRVMPFLQGITLRDALRAMTRAPDETWIRSVVDPVLDALELLHRQGVSHRDIAPDNIMLPSEGPPILLDFGAARRVIGDRAQAPAAGPKPGYAPIEQYAETSSLLQGSWTDLYSLGAVIHHLLFNAPPEPATARALNDDAALGLAQRQVPGVSARMIETVAWMLAVRPEDRPQDVATVRAALNGENISPADVAQDAAGDADGGRLDLAPLRDSGWREMDWRNLGWKEMRPRRETIGRFAAGVTLALLLGAGLLWQFVALLGAARHSAVVAATAASARSRAASIPGGFMIGAPSSSKAAAATSPAAAGATAALASAAAVVPVAAIVSASVGGSGSLPGVTAEAGRRVAVAGSAPTTVQASAASSSARSRALKAARGESGLATVPVDQVNAAANDGRSTAPTTEVAPGTGQTLPAPAAPVPASAREACGSRVFLALALCMERECEAPRYRNNPECASVIEMKRNREARYQ